MSYSIYATVGNLILLCELDTEDSQGLFGPLNNTDRHKFIMRSPYKALSFATMCAIGVTDNFA